MENTGLSTNTAFFNINARLSPEDLSHLTGVAQATLANWRSTNQGPAYFRFGRKVWYHLADVEEWMSSQRRNTNGVTKSERKVALPIPGRRTEGRRDHRFGGYETKRTKSADDGVAAPASGIGREMGTPPAGTDNIQ
jgi:predicted DNA-binding transcriptional regulator AlpA